MAKKQLFISYSGYDAFEASLLQYAFETFLSSLDVVVWTFHRDQARSETQIAQSLKQHVRESAAMIFLVSPTTLDSGASQWMELAYADAFEIPTFILLHHLDYDDLKREERGVPPLLLSSQCNAAMDWKRILEDVRTIVGGAENND
jgi:hypothetical protein